MTDIRALVPAPAGWRVAVATAYPAHGDRRARTDVEIVPLVGWAQIADPNAGTYWLPAWWDCLGLSTGYPQQAYWPLGPGEDMDDELRAGLVAEAEESLGISQRLAAERAEGSR